MDLGIDGHTTITLVASGGLGSAVAVALAVGGGRVPACGHDRGAGHSHPGSRPSWRAREPRRLPPVRPERDRMGGGRGAFRDRRCGHPRQHGSWRNGELGLGHRARRLETHFDVMVSYEGRPTHHPHRGMLARGWGRIVTNTSSVMVGPDPNLAMSNAPNATLVGGSKTPAGKVARDAVTGTSSCRVASRRHASTN